MGHRKTFRKAKDGCMKDSIRYANTVTLPLLDDRRDLRKVWIYEHIDRPWSCHDVLDPNPPPKSIDSAPWPFAPMPSHREYRFSNPGDALMFQLRWSGVGVED